MDDLLVITACQLLFIYLFIALQCNTLTVQHEYNESCECIDGLLASLDLCWHRKNVHCQISCMYLSVCIYTMIQYLLFPHIGYFVCLCGLSAGISLGFYPYKNSFHVITVKRILWFSISIFSCDNHCASISSTGGWLVSGI